MMRLYVRLIDRSCLLLMQIFCLSLILDNLILNSELYSADMAPEVLPAVVPLEDSDVPPDAAGDAASVRRGVLRVRHARDAAAAAVPTMRRYCIPVLNPQSPEDYTAKVGFMPIRLLPQGKRLGWLQFCMACCYHAGPRDRAHRKIPCAVLVATTNDEPPTITCEELTEVGHAVLRRDDSGEVERDADDVSLAHQEGRPVYAQDAYAARPRLLRVQGSNLKLIYPGNRPHDFSFCDDDKTPRDHEQSLVERLGNRRAKISIPSLPAHMLYVRSLHVVCHLWPAAPGIIFTRGGRLVVADGSSETTWEKFWAALRRPYAAFDGASMRRQTMEVMDAAKDILSKDHRILGALRSGDLITPDQSIYQLVLPNGQGGQLDPFRGRMTRVFQHHAIQTYCGGDKVELCRNDVFPCILASLQEACVSDPAEGERGPAIGSPKHGEPPVARVTSPEAEAASPTASQPAAPITSPRVRLLPRRRRVQIRSPRIVSDPDAAAPGAAEDEA